MYHVPQESQKGRKNAKKTAVEHLQEIGGVAYVYHFGIGTTLAPMREGIICLDIRRGPWSVEGTQGEGS